MTELICSICEEKFYANKPDNINGEKFSVTYAFKKHLQQKHNLTIEEYIIKTFFNGKRPICACGCGKELKFNQKNSLYSKNHGFGKYYHCSHVCIGDIIRNKKINNDYKTKYDDLEWCKEHYNEMYGWNNIENALKDFKTRTYTKTDICSKYKIDFRTLKGIWKKFNMILDSDLEDILKYNQFKLSAKHRRIFFDEKSSVIIDELYQILKKFPLQYNISSLIKYYNETNLKPIEYDYFKVLEELINKYGEEIYELILFGNHSKEEIEFIKILKFYFGKNKIIVGKKLQYGKNKKESYIYDICINNSLIIEYDSTGFFHTDKTRDKEKEDFAIQNGYKFMRISYKGSKNPETIQLIKNNL